MAKPAGNRKLKVVELPKEQVLEDYKTAFMSREASLIGRKEVLSGKAKFGIFGDGKEVAQVAMARYFQKGDWRSGYYRDQTFMFALGAATIRQFFAQLYADTDLEREPHSGGRQMNSHFASRSLDERGQWVNQLEQYNTSSDASPTACQMARLVGLGYASKLYRQHPNLDGTGFSNQGREIAFGTIGNASTSEGVFWECFNAAGVLEIPVVISVWDDEYGISVPAKFQTTKESISKICSGFEKEQNTNGYNILVAKGWDYQELIHAYRDATAAARDHHIPALVHVIEMTQPQGHSTSGSHERYKSKDRLEYESSLDCLVKMREWILDQGMASQGELDQLEAESKAFVQKERKAAWEDYLSPIQTEKQMFLDAFKEIETEHPELPSVASVSKALERNPIVNRKNNIAAARQILLSAREQSSSSLEKLRSLLDEQFDENSQRYNSKLFVDEEHSPLQEIGTEAIFSDASEKVDGRQVIQKIFDIHLSEDPRLFIIGEDVGKLGGVNLEFDGLSDKHGEHRVTDTGIREATILGQGIGAALRGLKPIVDIQYLDYLLYAFQVASDDLASLHYRTAGGQVAPVIMRTKGHRLEGIWHTGSPIGMILHGLRGIHVCVPRNMVQAAGLYNTLLAYDDPALVIEVLNSYRLKERIPDNLKDYKVPLGVPEVLHEGHDITLVTYGACINIAKEAVSRLDQLGISVELIDPQTLLPFDRFGKIGDSIAKTNCVLFLDEDVPGGATSYMMQQVLEQQQAYDNLDAPPRTLTAKAHRSPYGSDGDYFTKPSIEDVVETIYDMMHEREPARFPERL
ncbi:alpha-ketoacid dehydrogenase subunit alpha/beta [Pseudobacteriovorax antillogorgiicola]|uniref:3-methyl-2-oxobutanoate dehydrogenase (2-methylpropanoyl-transferring) n=1 Tax=Pseudobacteriovorax antillogorgiicola TaxID=1513793 RepID=A0A1Y6B745_9BACT|nr:alpha-ketoacid dehydrogenase subunit alpha/beta [Pseudobacteriovorax antillogorgiicola]TCS58639.1 pyruvate/2-oxoglutarate/acetoin dehydrogenase E1 component [Pseudobacteriovorax antillogorgiicola]SME96535.1 Pyruvate/2-oxoglutarate/acetoin dehydrogenase complex, dehydrogenase (E1) component [Pseudobacteriovorax antillogorgiicola]